MNKDPCLQEDLERLVDPVTRGDPEAPLHWTCKSVRKLAEELVRQGHQVPDLIPSNEERSSLKWVRRG